MNKRETATPVWTAQRVRDELPPVNVWLNGKVLPGRVVGRLNPFATVHFGDYLHGQWSWDTIASCLNRGEPLRGGVMKDTIYIVLTILAILFTCSHPEALMAWAIFLLAAHGDYMEDLRVGKKKLD